MNAFEVFLGTVPDMSAALAMFFGIRSEHIPAGAVMAFDIPCPKPDWTEYTDASGRVVIGTGGPTSRPLKSRNETGETRKLTERELPVHNHAVYPHAAGEELMKIPNPAPNPSPPIGWAFGAGAEDKNPGGTYVKATSRTGSAGEGKEFDIMPPFVALNYCRKVR